MNSKPKFANRVVIITGASSGIGKETALTFARECDRLECIKAVPIH